MIVDGKVIKNIYALYALAHPEFSQDEVFSRIQQLSTNMLSNITNGGKFDGDSILLIVSAINIIASCISTTQKTATARIDIAAFLSVMLNARVIEQIMLDNLSNFPRCFLQIVFSKKIDKEVAEITNEIMRKEDEPCE